MLGAFATALGVAIGIEALAFHALIGFGYAFRLVFDPKAARTRTGFYGSDARPGRRDAVHGPNAARSLANAGL